MNVDEMINGWTFEETIKTAESLMEVEKNMFKWDVIRHLRDFSEKYREQVKEYQQLEKQNRLVKLPCKTGDTYYNIEVNTDSCKECAFLQKGYYYDDFCINKAVRDENGDTLINPQYSDKVFCKKHFYEINKCCFDNVDEIFNLRKCFGKTVFFIKVEAEAELKKLRDEKEQ